MTYCSRTRPGLDIGLSGRTFGVCRQHQQRSGRAVERPHRIIGVLVEPPPKPRGRTWRSLLRRPPVAPKSTTMARRESERSARSAVAALASLAVHRPPTAQRKGKA